MSTHAYRRLLPFAFLLFPGCASTGPVACPASAAPPSALVGSAELRQTQGADLYEALRLSRPRFIRSRAATSPDPIVYLDGIRTAELGALHTVALPDVVDVRFMSGPDATTRFGTDHVGGALLIRTVLGPGSRVSYLQRCEAVWHGGLDVA